MWLTSGISTSGGRVLLADDNDLLRELLGQIISSCGFEVTEAEDGRHALDIFIGADKGFDLLITDLRMPRLSGGELIREIRRCKPDIPVIAITGYIDPATLDEVKALDVRLFSKPVDIDELRQYIHSLQLAA